jgi:ATP-dependent Clp protease protease subunit
VVSWQLAAKALTYQERTCVCVQAPIHTLCVGHAQSMAAILLAAGAKGHRHALPHSHIMVHQPSLNGSTGGKVSDIVIKTERLQKTSITLAALIAKHTGKVSGRLAFARWAGRASRD